MSQPTLRQEELSPIFSKFHLESDFGIKGSFNQFLAPESLDQPSHSHPFKITSHVIKGGFIERVFHIMDYGTWFYEDIERLPGTSYTIEADHIHIIYKLLEETALTFMLEGQWEKEPCFYDFSEPIAKVRQWNEEQFRYVV